MHPASSRVLLKPYRWRAFASPSSVSQPLSITNVINGAGLIPLINRNADTTLDRQPDGPMTPRNDAGPFVLDGSGSASRVSGERLRDASLTLHMTRCYYRLLPWQRRQEGRRETVTSLILHLLLENSRVRMEAAVEETVGEVAEEAKVLLTI